ncbi:hypothetical protein SDC9_191942 [bioreactor metagenome]|uniref:Uncharacterized protein n=1 Tax=bioreactor metagenome TaxID=1076179 RepID=A0A645HZC5_9ZZZZ
MLAGLAEQVAHPGSSHANEHLDEICSAHLEKGHLGFTGNRFGQQRFSSTRRTDEQHPLGNLAAYLGIFFGILKEVDDFLELLFAFIGSGHVGEAYSGIAFGHDLGLVLVEREHPLSASTLAEFGEDDPPDDQEDQHRQDIAEQALHNTGFGRCHRVVLDALLIEQRYE